MKVQPMKAEGIEVLDDCRYVAKVCLQLMGFIYAMN